jgi:hypothetical protein
MRICLFFTCFLMVLHAQSSSVGPDPQLVPGVLCTSSDPDFRGYEYPEKVARCNRNVSEQEKAEVAARFGHIPRDQWSQYEFDHLIPLCAGGSNSIENLWLQPIDEAKKKDVLEVDICLRMKAGTLKQADAVQKIHDWFQSNRQSQPLSENKLFLSKKEPSPEAVRCFEKNVNSTDPHLSLEFTDISKTQINDPQIMFVESDKDSEVTSVQGTLNGQLSRAQKGPLQGLFIFAVKDNKERFEIYLPENRKQKFNAYVKLSFEDSFPKMIQLECRENL